MDLAVQQIDARVYDALGIISRAGFRPRLQEGVSIVVSVPLNIGAQGALGFNDAETDSLAAFSGWTSMTASGVNLSAVQLLNPAGSGEVVYVDDIDFSTSNAADFVHFAFYSTPLATDVWAPVLKYGNALGVVSTRIRRSNPAAALTASTFRVSRAAVVDTDYTASFNPPLRLDAGVGVALWSESVNRTLTARFNGRKYAAVV